MRRIAGILAAAVVCGAAAPALCAATPDDPYKSVQHWTYSTQHDNMRNETAVTASVVSLNAANLAFPYQGGSHAILGFSKTLHKKPGYANILMLGLEKGQFTCPMTCSVAVKFDDGPVENFRGHGTMCGSVQCLGLITDTGKPLAERLLNTKKVIVELPIYDLGEFQFKFDTEGLKWTDSPDHQ